VKILIVDDDRDLVDLLNLALRRAGFEPLLAYDATMARRLLTENPPDLVVLDIGLGAENGLTLLEEIRRTTRVPVVMLTGRDTEEDKMLGLELGADDYVTKPFSHRELVARVRAVLRRYSHAPGAPPPLEPVLTVGPISLDPLEHQVLKRGQPISLSVTEFRLLHHLMVNAGRIVSVGTLLRHVWGHVDQSATELARITIERIRRKLEDDPGTPYLLHTVGESGVLLKPGGPDGSEPLGD
jgi:DNA-binding response OmpR family regulator